MRLGGSDICLVTNREIVTRWKSAKPLSCPLIYTHLFRNSTHFGRRRPTPLTIDHESLGESSRHTMRIVVVAIIILFISCSVATASTSISRLRFSSRQIDFWGSGGEDKKRPDQWDPCIFFLAVRWSARWRRYPTRTLRANALFVLSFSFRVGCGVWNLVSEKGETYADGWNGQLLLHFGKA